MPTGTITSVASVAGLSISSTMSRTSAESMAITDTLPIGYAGTLSTRTDNTNGEVTVLTGHGIATGEKFMIFHATTGLTYNCVAGTVEAPTSDTAIPFTLGVGDVLPTANTAVVVSEQIVHNIDFDFDDVAMVAAVSSVRSGIVFAEDDLTVLGGFELPASEPFQWASDTGITIPVTGNAVGVLIVAGGSTTTVGAFKFGAIIDSEA